MQKEFKHLHNRKIISFTVNITEMADTYQVEITLPGAKREDFFVHAYGNILSISLIHKEPEHRKKEKPQLHGFKYDFFDRQVILPDNADTEFISAEYLSDTLRLYIPKSIKPAKSRYRRIAVY